MKPKLADMGAQDIQNAYRRWAPVYDATFGRLLEAAAKQTVGQANQYQGKFLEAGVGTGLALPHYRKDAQITGIDLSSDMLKRAQLRISKHKCSNVEALSQMDAMDLQFADHSFDVSIAMFVLTVVPEPKRVIEELARVTRPGGRVIVANHFSVEHGLRGMVERKMAKHSAKLGWRPDFPISTILDCEKLKVCSTQQLKPWGFFTLVEFERVAS